MVKLVCLMGKECFQLEIDWLLHLFLWSWLWELAASVLLGPLNGILSVDNLYLIILEYLWSLTSLILLKLLLWGQISQFDLWLSERSVDGIGLNHSYAWNWVIVGWDSKHNIIGNAGGLGESLTILVEVQLRVVVKGFVHGI